MVSIFFVMFKVDACTGSIVLTASMNILGFAEMLNIAGFNFTKIIAINQFLGNYLARTLDFIY